MKKFYLLIVALNILCASFAQKTYVINYIGGSEQIKIGDKNCKKGDSFRGNDTIHWTKDDQWMDVECEKNGKVYRCSKKGFERKNAISLIDYFFKITRSSGKSPDDWNLECGKSDYDIPERRIALVVGNANYVNLSPLRNPMTEVEEVSKTLKLLGFDVICVNDVNADVFELIFKRFCKVINDENYKAALFYYSGHGFSANGKDYLLTIDADINDVRNLSNQISIADLKNELKECKDCPTIMMVMDACRYEDNYFRAVSNKTNNIQALQGQFLAYSSQSGGVSYDRINKDDEMGPYAKAFIRCVQKKECPLNKIFDEISKQVVSETDSVQIPTYNDSLNREVPFFIGGKMIPDCAYIQRSVMLKDVSFDMVFVEGGTFPMGGIAVPTKGLRKTSVVKELRELLRGPWYRLDGLISLEDLDEDDRVIVDTIILIDTVSEVPKPSRLDDIHINLDDLYEEDYYVEHNYNIEETDTSKIGSLVSIVDAIALYFDTIDVCHYYGKEPESCDKVELQNYYIGKFPVTQAQWKSVMRKNPSEVQGDDMPVTNVSIKDIQKFIDRLNKKTNMKFRLPTEAEWEFAARGGNLSKHYRFSGSDDFEDVGWGDKWGDATAHSVGLKLPNELFLYDMSGNVGEICFPIEKDNEYYKERGEFDILDSAYIHRLSEYNNFGFRLVLDL